MTKMNKMGKEENEDEAGGKEPKKGFRKERKNLK